MFLFEIRNQSIFLNIFLFLKIHLLCPSLDTGHTSHYYFNILKASATNTNTHNSSFLTFISLFKGYRVFVKKAPNFIFPTPA